jgi:hypothetical protein
MAGLDAGHLQNLRNDKEDVAVERFLNLLPAMVPVWYQSIGIDPHFHWALVRPVLDTPMLRTPQVEIDVIFGRMITLADSLGSPSIIWPPPTDYMVAVEAKCPPVTWEDTEPWARAVLPKSNLRQQLERNLELRFSRVAALHIIATPPSDEYRSALRTADILGRHAVPEAERQIQELTRDLPVGHCILSVGGISWKHEGLSGAMMPIKVIEAPLVGNGLDAVRIQIDAFLTACPPPYFGNAIYVREKSGWRHLGRR